MISYRRAASSPPEMLAVIEQHEPGAVITNTRMPPTGRDEDIQAAAGCNPAVDTPATAGIRGPHAHNRTICMPCPEHWCKSLTPRNRRSDHSGSEEQSRSVAVSGPWF